MKKLAWTIALSGIISMATAQKEDQGLVGDYYEGSDFKKKVMTRTDAQINFVWNNTAPVSGMDPEHFSIRWRGKIRAPETGTYVFRAHVDDGIKVKVNNQLIIDAWGMHDSERFTGSIYLEAGHYYDLYVSYFNGMLEGEIQLFWQLPSEAKKTPDASGHRDKMISGSYLYKKVPAPVVAEVKQEPAPKPRQTVKPVVKPPQKKPKPRPVITQPAEKPKPVETPVVEAKPETPVKAAAIPADTLKKYIPKNVLFVQTKPTILKESYPELDKLSRFLVNNPTLRLSIAGHTDKLGNPANNLKLSEARAQTVANYLTEKGVAAERITTKGYGDTKPLIKKPHVKNRRVEFLVY